MVFDISIKFILVNIYHKNKEYLTILNTLYVCAYAIVYAIIFNGYINIKRSLKQAYKI